LVINHDILGIIITLGTENGILLIYCVQSLMDGKEALLCEEQLFDSAVLSMDYNTFKPHLMAVGGNEEVLIVNLEGGVHEP